MQSSVDEKLVEIELRRPRVVGSSLAVLFAAVLLMALAVHLGSNGAAALIATASVVSVIVLNACLLRAVPALQHLRLTTLIGFAMVTLFAPRQQSEE